MSFAQTTSYHPVSPGEFSSRMKDRLRRVDGEESPFSDLDWFEMLYAHGFPAGFDLTYLVADERDVSPSFCIPLVSAHEASTPRRLEALSNYYSPVFAPLLAPGSAGAAANALGAYVAGNTTSADIVDLRPMNADSAFFKEARAALEGVGYWTDCYFCFHNWYLEVAGRNYDEYFRGLPGRIKNSVPRKRRRLEETGLAIKIVTGPSPDLEWAIAAYQQVYSGSWKRPEPYPEFIPSLCRLAAEKSWLRLGILSLKGVPVAAQLWLVKDGVAYIYKLAYLEEHAKQSVGTILTCAMMQWVIDADKVRIVDYGIGDDTYKREWMSHCRERHGLIAFNKSRPMGILAAARHFGGKAIKPLLRRFISATSEKNDPHDPA